MEENESTGLKSWVSIVGGLVGVSLIGGSFFVTGEEAHGLFYAIIQLLMIVSGSVAIITAVICFFLRDSPDIWL